MNSNDFVICTKGLSKSFGEVYALKSLDLPLLQKAIFTLLGPNGAGKTTTIKLLRGLSVWQQRTESNLVLRCHRTPFVR